MRGVAAGVSGRRGVRGASGVHVTGGSGVRGAERSRVLWAGWGGQGGGVIAGVPEALDGLIAGVPGRQGSDTRTRTGAPAPSTSPGRQDTHSPTHPCAALTSPVAAIA